MKNETTERKKARKLPMMGHKLPRKGKRSYSRKRP